MGHHFWWPLLCLKTIGDYGIVITGKKVNVVKYTIQESQSCGTLFSAILGVLMFLFAAVAFFAVLSVPQLELACNEASAKAAQDFFNRTASNSGVSLRLKNPRLVSKTETSVKCRVNSNINQDMYYHLELQDDGTVLIVFGCDMTERTNSLLQK